MVFSAVAGNELDAATVFTSIALFENMKDPLSRLPDRITSFVDLSVASQRLETFLAREEVSERGSTSRSDSDGLAIRLDSGSFGWGQTQKIQVKPKKAKHNVEKSKPGTGDQGYQQLGQDDLEDVQLVVDAEESVNSPETALLRNISLRIAHGELVCESTSDRPNTACDVWVLCRRSAAGACLVMSVIWYASDRFACGCRCDWHSRLRQKQPSCSDPVRDGTYSGNISVSQVHQFPLVFGPI